MAMPLPLFERKPPMKRFHAHDDGETTCCYARGDKHWIADPQGIAWEHFHTLDNIPVFSETQVPVAAVPAVPALISRAERDFGAQVRWMSI